MTDHTEPLAAAVRDLVEVVRLLDTEPERIASAADRVRAIADELRPDIHTGDLAQASLDASHGPFDAPPDDPGEFFPYSPVVGPRNPIAPPVELSVDGDRLVGTMTLTAPYVGPPNTVHGGVVALVFDELLGAMNVVAGHGAMTGTLTIRYRRPTPIGAPVELTSWIDRVEGRKVFTRGEFRHEGELTAEAEGIFIKVQMLEPPT